MRIRDGQRRVPWISLAIAMLIAIGASTITLAQPPATNLPSPSNPVPSAPPMSPEAYEARIQQLEAKLEQLSNQMQQFQNARPIQGSPDPGTVVGAPGVGAAEAGAGAITPSATGGATAPGQSLPPNPSPSNRFNSPATLESRPGAVKFGPGFEIKSNDDEFYFQFHNLTQVDYRGYNPGGQNPVHDTFVLPRQWFMFSGRITRPIGYFVSFQNVSDTLSGLDMFVDLNYNPKLQGRIGRFKTPFTYEFFVEPIQGLINPERSIFYNNFGENRDVGAMAYGRLFKNKIDYAVGVFNGNRNGYVATQDSKFVTAFLNWKPFQDHEGGLLENFNVGGSVFSGSSYSLPVPAQLRTAVPTTGNSVLGVPFLTFNNSVRETGNQTFWDLHVAYYYKQLALISEWGSGAKDYSLTTNPTMRTRLPVNSFYVAGGYLLTGETRSSNGIVKPLNPFDLKAGQRGYGAWELVERVQYMDIGSQVFTAGLSDPNTSANRVFINDLGFNWHMTQYLKVYFEWEHSEFNQPVIYAPGKRQLTNDLFLVRLQLYF